MGKPYSDDLRERVVAAIEAGQTRVKVAKLYNMALSTVGGFIKRKRETGSVSPDKFGGHKTFALEPHTALEHFSIRLGVSRVCEISFAFFFGNPFEKRGDCSPKLLNGARLHLA